MTITTVTISGAHQPLLLPKLSLETCLVSMLMLHVLLLSPCVKGSLTNPEECSCRTRYYRRQDFRLVRRLGAGKFSDVFEAVHEDVITHRLRNGPSTDFLEREKTLVVIKCLKPVSERKIKRELLVLSSVSNLPNMARLIGVCWEVHKKNCNEIESRNINKSSYFPAIILQHAGSNSQWLCHGVTGFLSKDEIKYFLFHLLQALSSLHSNGIMHRDVKPRNVLITREDFDLPSGTRGTWKVYKGQRKRSIMLIDFGLADFYLPGQRYNVRVASRHYKAPELLINYEYYDYSLDIWSVGCILAGLLLRREPFFRGQDNTDQLKQIASILGGADLLRYCKKMSVQLTPELQKAAEDFPVRRPWLSMVPRGCPDPDRQGLDLLDKLLVYDHTHRLTAAEAMNHSFFDDVRCERKLEKNGNY